jgi:hypothetical protein
MDSDGFPGLLGYLATGRVSPASRGEGPTPEEFLALAELHARMVEFLIEQIEQSRDLGYVVRSHGLPAVLASLAREFGADALRMALRAEPVEAARTEYRQRWTAWTRLALARFCELNGAKGDSEAARWIAGAAGLRPDSVRKLLGAARRQARADQELRERAEKFAALLEEQRAGRHRTAQEYLRHISALLERNFSRSWKTWA